MTVDDVSFTYTRHVATDANGQYTVTVADPGTFRVNGTTIEVSDAGPGGQRRRYGVIGLPEKGQ